MNLLETPPINGSACYILLRSLIENGHQRAAERDNASTSFLLGSYQVNGQDAIKSIMSALGTMGGLHAPVANCYQLLSNENMQGMCIQMLNSGMRIPGYGNSFIKHAPDRIWDAAEEELEKVAPEIHSRITGGRKVLQDAGKDLYPNAAMYTAALAILLKIPAKLSPMLVVEFRAGAWRQLLTDTYYTTQTKEGNN